MALFYGPDGMCKHTMNVFNMCNPDIEDGFIVKKIGTMH